MPTASPSWTSPTSRARLAVAGHLSGDGAACSGAGGAAGRAGRPVGGRVAVVSHNSARLLTSFFGVSGWGRMLVPINFRLAVPEIEYIVEHCGAEVVLVDPELRQLLDAVDVRPEFVLGE